MMKSNEFALTSGFASGEGELVTRDPQLATRHSAHDPRPAIPQNFRAYDPAIYPETAPQKPPEPPRGHLKGRINETRELERGGEGLFR